MATGGKHLADMLTLLKMPSGIFIKMKYTAIIIIREGLKIVGIAKINQTEEPTATAKWKVSIA